MYIVYFNLNSCVCVYWKGSYTIPCSSHSALVEATGSSVSLVVETWNYEPMDWQWILENMDPPVMVSGYFGPNYGYWKLLALGDSSRPWRELQ